MLYRLWLIPAGSQFRAVEVLAPHESGPLRFTRPDQTPRARRIHDFKIRFDRITLFEQAYNGTS